MNRGRDRWRGCRGTLSGGEAGLAALTRGAIAVVLTGAVPAALPAQEGRAATSLVFDQVTVVDVEQGKLVPEQRVVVTGNRIAAVGTAGTVKAPQGAQVVDAQGKYLIPGLWDLHTRSGPKAPIFYPLFLANGVTGIRDVASETPLATLRLWQREILAGTRVGPPRQILSGKALDGNQSNVPERQPGITTPELARRAVDSLKAAGADMIKVYSLSKEVYLSVAAEARRVGIPFGGHIGGNRMGENKLTALEASDSGTWILDANAGDIMTPCWEDSATVDRCGPVAERFRRNNTWWVPTLVRNARSNARNNRSRDTRSQVLGQRFDASVFAYWLDPAALTPLPQSASLAAGGGAAPPGSFRSAAAAQGYMRVVEQAGLPVLAGTDVAYPSLIDVPAGFTLHAELAMYVAEGMTSLAALRTATLNPAKALRATDSLGTVAPGKLADLVLLDADPLADIINTTTIRAVVANGRYFDRAALDRLLAEAKAAATRRASGRP